MVKASLWGFKISGCKGTHFVSYTVILMCGVINVLFTYGVKKEQGLNSLQILFKPCLVVNNLIPDVSFLDSSAFRNHVSYLFVEIVFLHKVFQSDVHSPSPVVVRVCRNVDAFYLNVRIAQAFIY